MDQADFKSAIVQAILDQLKALTDDERKWLFHNFCHFCGSDHLPCHCWNDE